MINRREFLKMTGAATMLMLIPLNRLGSLVGTPLEVQVDGMLYRGTLDGKIFVSTDLGRTWDLHTNLGPDYAVLDIFPGRGGQVFAKIGYRGHSFVLVAANQGKVWRTLA